MFGMPPEIVPDDLTARQYYELGIWYEETHLYSLARQALLKAIAIEPDSEIAIQSKRLLDARIPRIDVSKETIQRFWRAETPLLKSKRSRMISRE